MTQDVAQTDVIIAGGGIGGMGAALMLARQGISVTVLERAAEFGEVGAGLQLAPNITRMLDEVGVLEEILPLAVQPRRLVFRNAATGDELTHLDLEDVKARYGGTYIVIHRRDLLDALTRAAHAQPGVTLLTGQEVTEIEDHGDRVSVRRSDGLEITGQLLVGADGLHSVVRRYITEDEPVCSGYVAYRGATPIQEVDFETSADDVVVWMGPGLHLVQYPLRGGDLFNQVAVFKSQRYADGQEDWGTPEELDAAYSPMAEPVRTAVPALQRVKRWQMSDRNPLSAWTRGRVTLLGDAAHAMLQYLAQGAGQSLLDGAALTATLSGLGDGPWNSEDLTKALETYEERRVEAAGAVQTTARLWGSMWHVDDPVAMLLRDEAFRRRDVHDYHLLDWLYGPIHTTEADKAPNAEGPAPAPIYF